MTEFSDSLNDATVPAGSNDGDSKLTDAELRALLGDVSGESFSEYSDRKLLGLGGMGAVYSGTEQGLNRTVAVKVLRPQYRYSAERIEAFVREARLTAKIDHPNIIPVHRFGVFDDAGVYFTMRRIAGHTLGSIISGIRENRDDYRHQYTLRRLIGIFLSTCNAIAFAHSRGVMHGDLKPGNIMVGKYGEVLVMDWGLAYDENGSGSKDDKLKKALLPDLKKEGKNDIGGTPAYMPPEHVSGEFTTPDRKSEVYCLGAILYSILTLKDAPFAGSGTGKKLAEQILTERPKVPRKAAPKFHAVPRELEAICLKAMAKRRSERYESVEELISDITNYLDGYPVKAYSPLFIYKLQKRIMRKPLVPALVFVSLLLGTFFYELNMLETRKSRQMHREIALHASEQSSLFSRKLRQICRKARTQNIPEHQRANFFQELSSLAGRCVNTYEIALDNLVMLPADAMKTDIQVIITDLVLTAIDMNTYSFAKEAASGFRNSNMRLGTSFLALINRNKYLSAIAIYSEPRLKELYRKIAGEKGRLRLMQNNDTWQLTVADRTAPGGEIRSFPFCAGEIELAPGNYVVTFSSSEIGAFNVPLVVGRANTFICDIRLPAKKIPQGMMYVAGAAGNKSVKGFFIKKEVVTISEYMQFWKSLPERARKNRMIRFFSKEKGNVVDLWNSNFEIAHPYSAADPVFGLSRSDAEAYCSWLSRKSGCTVRLPSISEWQRAAFSFASGKISAYGVSGLNRNIRELLSSEKYGAASANIGFRYIMDLSEDD